MNGYKTLKIIILTAIFLGGLTAFSVSEVNAKTADEAALIIKVPCTTVCTVCDEGFPDNHWLFTQCIENIGC